MDATKAANLAVWSEHNLATGWDQMLVDSLVWKRGTHLVHYLATQMVKMRIELAKQKAQLLVLRSVLEWEMLLGDMMAFSLQLMACELVQQLV